MSTIGTDALAAFAFNIKIDGYEIAQFQKVDGISIEIQPIEYRAVSLKEKGPVNRKSPGLKKYGDITLSRGKVTDIFFWEWIKNAQLGKLADARKNGVITLLDYDFMAKPIQQIKFTNAWPTKVSLGSLAAGSNEIMVETIVLCVESYEVK